jgi:transcriptional regulator with XRE-family HTH domain
MSSPPPSAPLWTAQRLRDLRHTLHLSQAALAHELNVSAQAVRGWEQDQKRPSGTASRLLDLFESHPALIGARRAIDAHDPRRRHADEPNADATAPGEGVRPAPDTDRAPAIAPSRPKLLPEWWREETIVRLVTALYRYVRQYADPYSLLVAPRVIDGVDADDARIGYPDIYVIDPAPTLDGRRTTITSLRLAIDVLPVRASATATVTAASRLRNIAVEEHWLVDPFAHRVTVRRVADSTTRHHRREIVWRITPYARPVSVFVRPLFMPTIAWPIILEPTPSPGLVEATAEVLGS